MISQLKMLFALVRVPLYTVGGTQVNIATPPKVKKKRRKHQTDIIGPKG